MLDSLQIFLYNLAQKTDVIVSQQLTNLTNFSVIGLGILFGAGLLTSLTPCMLSMLPVTIGYIGGYEAEGRLKGFLGTLWFALGLATTLSIFGVIAASLGRVYGQIGSGLPIFVGAIAVLMGLNLLEVVHFPLLSWGGTDWINQHWPKGVRSYFLGVMFGIAASPCSTPVLATLLAWVGQTQKIALGGLLLFCYAVGYVTPLIIAGTFTASIKKLLEFRRCGSWINPISGAALVGFGVFSILSRLPISLS